MTADTDDKKIAGIISSDQGHGSHPFSLIIKPKGRFGRNQAKSVIIFAWCMVADPRSIIPLLFEVDNIAVDSLHRVM